MRFSSYILLYTLTAFISSQIYAMTVSIDPYCLREQGYDTCSYRWNAKPPCIQEGDQDQGLTPRQVMMGATIIAGVGFVFGGILYAFSRNPHYPRHSSRCQRCRTRSISPLNTIKTVDSSVAKTEESLTFQFHIESDDPLDNTIGAPFIVTPEGQIIELQPMSLLSSSNQVFILPNSPRGTYRIGLSIANCSSCRPTQAYLNVNVDTKEAHVWSHTSVFPVRQGIQSEREFMYEPASRNIHEDSKTDE